MTTLEELDSRRAKLEELAATIKDLGRGEVLAAWGLLVERLMVLAHEQRTDEENARVLSMLSSGHRLRFTTELPEFALRGVLVDDYGGETEILRADPLPRPETH